MKRIFISIFILYLTVFSLQGQSVCAKRQFPIIASHALKDGYGTIENYQTLEEAGFNFAITILSSKEEVIKHLKAASKTNVKLIIWCPEIESKTSETVSLLSGFKSLGGYYIDDELGVSSFVSLSKQYKRLREFDEKRHIWINIYPNYATTKQIEIEKYEKYVENYLQIVNPSFLSFDHYGINKNGLRSDFYENLEIISKQCKLKNIPFWAYVLSSEFDDYQTPSKGSLSFQAYSNIAYGAKGIEYYTYRLSGDMRSAIVDANYRKMPIYDAVKELNSEIQFYSKYFIDDIVEDVTHFGSDIPIGSKASNQIQNNLSLISCDGKGFVVSSFSRRGRKYLLLVNKDYENAQGITIESSGKIKRVSYFKNERTRRSGLLHFVAQPGSIILLSL